MTERYQGDKTENANLGSPHVEVFPTGEQASLQAANILIDVLNQKPDASIAIAGGNTTKGLLSNLLIAQSTFLVDFSHAKFIGLDQYWPISPEHPISSLRRLEKDFYKPAGISPSQVHYPDGSARTIEDAVERFTELVTENGPLDLVVLGIGPGVTCHVGMNNRGASVDSRVHYEPLDEASIATMMHKLKLSREQMPSGGITLGMADLLESNHAMTLIFGEDKAWGANRSITGDIGSEAPSSFLRLHPNHVFLLDEPAAGDLPSQYK